MIRWFILGVATLVAAPFSWATKSRLDSLRQPTDGSYVFLDERNVFLNPAQVHLLNRQLSFEWGGSGTATKVDSDTSPKAEGGWFDGSASYPHAAYLGREEESVVTHRNLSGSTPDDYLKPDNTFDLTLGLGRGRAVRYGLALSFSKNQDEVTGGLDRDETFTGFRGGALVGEQWEVFCHYHLVDDAKGSIGSEDQYQGQPSGLVGAIFKWKDYRAYASIKKKDSTKTPIATRVDLDFLETTALLGISQTQSLRAKALLFWSADLDYTASTTDYTATSKGEVEWLRLKLALGLEDQVNDWLSLRGAVTQNLLLNSYKSKLTGSPEGEASVEDTTWVTGGLSLHFDAIRLDGSFAAYSGTLNGGNIMSRVAMTYVH